MKLVAVFVLLFVVSVSNNSAEDGTDLVGDNIPLSIVLAAARSVAEEEAKFVAANDDAASASKSNDNLNEDPFFRGIFKKRCRNGECRKKCNAKGQNGACVWIKCVCWK